MTPVDQRLFIHLNWALLGLALVLFSLGVLNLYSASSLRGIEGLAVTAFYKKQLIWGTIAFAGMLLFMSFDYRHLEVLAWPLYWVTVVLLLIVPLWGKTIYGAQRWVSLGFFNLQPSELAKVAVLLVGARMLARVPGLLNWPGLMKVVLMGGLPAGLIIIQPDLGSGLNLLLLLGGMILYKGMWRPVAKTLFISLPLLVPCGWFFLHDYQKQRILTFLHPGSDPLGSGYHILQSQIAIGSGQFWGKGFLGGTQSQLRFLPEKHTDFAFAVFGEEWGFVGCIALLSLFCLFLFQISLVAQESKDSFGSYVAAGVFFYFFWQILINMGMVLGLMPVVGIPLPFLSYGGSSLVVNCCLLGMVLNVSMRRYVFKQGQN
ncbi:rod shape-determining protein RodA [Desulfohalobium retbaense]|uniref:Peptidoglycan glycosyltransferase RodA n=1 Tax=Desulfohalobium retbaense (strain ATCC 49708 / DSM 5692 / JCM 16813 / HR100) TaxID=485915 RepID=C8X505_DESRD|nr:rod shape-determining protein RodA [Desulfohalobium retbaense]ACV69502.1 rod shape-determining protein RodA [Desulfohalobium retbaense DSM 5692]